MPSDGAEGNRRKGRTKAGCADIVHRRILERGHTTQRPQIGRLALIGRHAGRRIALHVFDGPEAFAVREIDIRHGRVMLQIDEHLSGHDAGLVRHRRGVAIERSGCAGERARRQRQRVADRAVEADLACRVGADGKPTRRVLRPGRRGRNQAGKRKAGSTCRIWKIGAGGRVENRAMAELAPQMEARRPTARNRQQVGADRARIAGRAAGLRVDGNDIGGRDAPLATRLEHGVADDDLDTRLVERRLDRGIDVGS